MTQQLHRRDESSKYTHAALWVCDQTSESSIFMVMAGQRCAGGKHKERQPFDVLSINRNVQQEHFKGIFLPKTKEKKLYLHYICNICIRLYEYKKCPHLYMLIITIVKIYFI